MPEAKEIPDVYSDLFDIKINPIGGAIVFTKSHFPLTAADKPGAESVGVVRMSLQNMKVLTMVMRRVLKEVEAGKPIYIPEAVLTSLKLVEADW